MKISVSAIIMLVLMAQGAYAEEQVSLDGQNSDDSDIDFTITPVNVLNNEVFNVVVIGDSIAWGAGLKRDEKYSYLVAKWLSEELNRPVNVKVLAHTGATLCTENYDPIRPPDLSSGNPPVSQQADIIQNPDSVNLILISGGINDIGVENIIKLDHLTNIADKSKDITMETIDTTKAEVTGIYKNPVRDYEGATFSKNDIKTKCSNLETPMRLLLVRLLSICPNAKIVVTSYYPIISEDSKGLTETIKALSPESQNLNDYKNLDELTRRKQLEEKSNMFFTESKKSLISAVDGANSGLGDNRVAFAQIDFLPENCYGAAQSLLWKIGNFGGIIKTDDNMYNYRMSLLNEMKWVCACEPCLTPPDTVNPKNVDCDIYRKNKFVAVGHPNELGAEKYNESIIKSISDTWPEWLHPTVLAFDVSHLSLVSGESLAIDYTVSDNDGSGLTQVELWRKNETSDWQEIVPKRNILSGETGPLSGSFTDSPPAPGEYWYGVHVVDNAGNWNDERNSNTNYQPISFEPVEVEVKAASAKSEISSKALVEKWNRTLCSITNEDDDFFKATSDGNYILAGDIYYYNSGKRDACLIKISSDGNVVWNKTYGGENSDYVESVEQTSDGGYILAGFTNSFGYGFWDAWVVKVDSGGNEVWNKTFGGSYDDRAHSVIQTGDGDYIIGGRTESFDAGISVSDISPKQNAWLIKTDSKGNELWNKTFIGVKNTDADWIQSIQPTSNGGYIVVGETYSYDTEILNNWLVKIDSEGNELWTKRLVDSDGFLKYPSVQLASDGGYIINSITQSFGAGSLDAWVIKVDSGGKEVWNRTFGGAELDSIYSIQQTNDGGYIMGGYTYSLKQDHGTGWLVKVNSEGNEIWNRTIDDSDCVNSILPTEDGGYILAVTQMGSGIGSTDGWLIKIDSQYKEIWNMTFGSDADEIIYSIFPTLDGGYILEGISYGTGDWWLWLVKVAPTETR